MLVGRQSDRSANFFEKKGRQSQCLRGLRLSPLAVRISPGPPKILEDYDLAPSSWNAYSNPWSGLVSKSGTLFNRCGTARRLKSWAWMLFFRSFGDSGNETGAPGSGLRENGAAIVFCRPFWK